MLSKPRYYVDVCLEKPREHSDYDNVDVKWGSQDNYEVTKKIGRGKYSEVYEGYNV